MKELWTVASINPRIDADRLLADFLPRAFRRPSRTRSGGYVAKVEERIKATASRPRCAGPIGRRSARRTFSITSSPRTARRPCARLRLSTSCGTRCPTTRSRSSPRQASCATQGPQVQVDRLLKDRKSQRFVENFWASGEAPADRGQRPRPEALPRVQPLPAGLHGRGDPRLLPRADREEPAGGLPREVRLRDAQREARRPLWDPGRQRSRHPPRRPASEFTAGRLPHPGGDPEGHRERHDHVAGPARRVRDGPAAGPASRAAAVERPGGRARRAGRDDHPRAARKAPERGGLRLLPREDRSAGLRPRGVRRDRRPAEPLPLDRRGGEGAARVDRPLHRHRLQARPGRRRLRHHRRRPSVRRDRRVPVPDRLRPLAAAAEPGRAVRPLLHRPRGGLQRSATTSRAWSHGPRSRAAGSAR